MRVYYMIKLPLCLISSFLGQKLASPSGFIIKYNMIFINSIIKSIFKRNSPIRKIAQLRNARLST